MDARIAAKKLMERFGLEVVAGAKGLSRKYITLSDVHRPGLELAGYYAYYPSDRVQLLGRTEISFAESLSSSALQERFHFLCQEDTPCICVTHGMDTPSELMQAAEESWTPLFKTSLATTQFISKVTNYLEEMLAPTTTVHGVLVDVYGIGALLVGGSGIGKSETALELVKRGHRLVADDAVEIRQTQDNQLIGNPPELIQNLLEIRGLGIINVMTLFGAGVVRNFKKITLVIRLEAWDERKQYDRLGLDEEKYKIIDTELPIITIPVRPGRNLGVIVEVAAMNFRLKMMGHNAAVQFAERLNHVLEFDLDE